MLEKPDLPDETLAACLREAYGLAVREIAFLPIGADQYTAVYRLRAVRDEAYFLKLRRGAFDDLSVTLPAYLHAAGLRQVIAPLATQTGPLWASLEGYRLILYPWVEGRDGYEARLSDRQWVELGAALKKLHSIQLPPALRGRLRRETFTPQWRESVKASLKRVEDGGFDDPIAVRLAGILIARRVEILDLVQDAQRLAQSLQRRTLKLVLCHSDVHAGNVLVHGDDQITIVDWDEPILAPKERDLMFPGSGLFADHRTPQEEENLFYQGYGEAPVDREARTYYRYERILTDIAVECEQILQQTIGLEDREQALGYLIANFDPSGTIAIARQADRA